MKTDGSCAAAIPRLRLAPAGMNLPAPLHD